MHESLTDPPLLLMENISKEFPGVKALDRVTFDLRSGEVHALVGANGAGKSTLINILGGVYGDYEGSIFINGRKAKIHSPRASQRIGIALIPQDLVLVNDLSVSENIFLGRQPISFKPLGIVDKNEMNRRAAHRLGEFGLSLDPRTKLANLSSLERRVVEIVRAIDRESRFIVMDEPTADLSLREANTLYRIIRTLKTNNVPTIFISHRFEDIFEVADRVTILREGRVVYRDSVRSISSEKIVQNMMGRQVSIDKTGNTKTYGPTILKVQDLCGAGFRDITFRLASGETLGIVSRSGNESRKLLRLLFGAIRKDSGSISVNGEEADIMNPRHAIANGISYLSDDRMGDSLFPLLSVKLNITLPFLKRFSIFGMIKPTDVSNYAQIKVKELEIKVNGIDDLVSVLSGGNQQKVILARWFSHDALKVFLFEEPTKGIDIGTKMDLYQIIRRLNNDGVGCMVSSSDLDEILAISDRILVIDSSGILRQMEAKDLRKGDLLSLVMGDNVAG